jgi:tetratricopeptide (TPR) repeat protein
LESTNSSAFFLRGNIKDSFDDRHGAMKDYNVAIERNPKFADAFFARGNVKMKLQDYYGAIADYSSAIALNENYIDAYFKHILPRKSIGYLDVGYQQRHSGRSNFSLWKKLAASAKFGPEYYARPLSWMVTLTVLLATIDFFKLYDYWQPLEYLQALLPYLFLIAFVVIAFYLAQIYLMLKGRPVYVVLDELK